MRAWTTITVLSAFLSLSGMAQASLITNGTFDTDLSGWDYVQYVDGVGGAQWAADAGGIAYIRADWDDDPDSPPGGGQDGRIWQANLSHPFAAGETYTVSVDLTNGGGGGQPNIDIILYDTTAGEAVASLTVPAATLPAYPTFAPFSFNYAVEAGRVGNNWQLRINSTHWGAYTGIDNASVTAVPEPSAALLLGAGLIGLVARRSRR